LPDVLSRSLLASASTGQRRSQAALMGLPNILFAGGYVIISIVAMANSGCPRSRKHPIAQTELVIWAELAYDTQY
jgi:hypothetical protein